MDSSFIMLIYCMCTYLIGLATGLLCRPRPQKEADAKRVTEENELMKKQLEEFRNFLSYDGSIQV